jgi:CRISPR-associated endonuclease/helicase Cas3
MRAAFDRLLAKSCPDLSDLPPSALLPQHLADVYCAARAVLQASGDDQLRAVSLSPEAWFPRLRQVVLLAAALHDLGKANDHFQETVRRQRTQAQGLRHEWVTYWLLEKTSLRQWVSCLLDPKDWQVVLWAIVGHHPRHDRPTPPKPLDGAGSKLVVLLEHQDCRDALAWIGREFALPKPPALENISLNLATVGPGNAFSCIHQTFMQHRHVWENLDANCRLFAAVCKACLLGVDVAGSALLRGISTPAAKAEWINRSLHTCPGATDVESLVRERLKGQAERPFQRQVAEREGRVVLLRAACGTGKTLAAYLRAARRWPAKRIYFCYPTTGTATEGFRGYLFDPDAGRSKYGARLFHSRAATDLEMILHAAGDEDRTDEMWRGEALLAWSTPIVSCTVDTVLSLLQNQRRGLFAWPALAQSAFVFDEIHAYDQKLFGALLRFLEALRGVPILLMTASLPAACRKAIADCLERQGEVLTEVSGPGEIEELPRYHRMNGADPFQAVREEMRCGGKVLWVCNTVARAMETVAKLADCEPLVYHSRFRYEDRVARHWEVVRAFERQRSEPALAVCTQVAEMSLDLSATLLVTDLAPVPALIQRLGRLNRWALPPGHGEPVPPTRPFIVIEPSDNQGSLATAPYDTGELGDWPAVSRRWLAVVQTQGISQSDLTNAWQELETGEVPCPAASPWLDGGPATPVDATREASPGITVILEGRDSDDVKAGKPVAQVAVPMPPPPRQFNWRQWRRVQGFPLAPASSIIYDPKRGASWREV